MILPESEQHCFFHPDRKITIGLAKLGKFLLLCKACRMEVWNMLYPEFGDDGDNKEN